MGYREASGYRPPPSLHRRINRLVAALAALGLSPRDTVALEVRGRRSGRPRRTAVVWAEHVGQRYLVSLAGESQWVRNVRAAGGAAVLRHGRGQPVRLEEIPPEARAPVLRAYAGKRSFSRSPAYIAREYLGVRPHPTVEELEPITARYPVFRIRTDPATGGRDRDGAVEP